MDAAAGDQFHCQTNAASVALKDSHAAKRANAETALLSAQQTRALQEARHRAEMAEAEARRINNRRARPWRGRQFRELKKIIISAPRECPIDLFGPRTNRTPLERLHGVFPACLLVPYMPLARRLAGSELFTHTAGITRYAGAGVPQHARHRRCRSGAGLRKPPNQCAASVTTGRAPTLSARTDRNRPPVTELHE